MLGLPRWLADDVRAYVLHCARRWPADRQVQGCTDRLRRLTASLRWMEGHSPLQALTDIRPERWLAYLDERLAAGITPTTLNHELNELQQWLSYWHEQGRPICQRTVLIEKLKESDPLPQDVPVEQPRLLLAEIEREAQDERPHRRRTGRMDQAWVLLMLHSGLRTLEVRRLMPGDIDWHRRLVRIEQSKGLHDRMVPLSRPTVAALRAYLEVRGPASALPDNVFAYRQQPLARYYCYHRLHTYGKRCGVWVHPHQLRHSCATLLLNASAPILAVQAILGHTQIQTTLEYARLYDGTIAADYYAAMTRIEMRLDLAAGTTKTNEPLIIHPFARATLLALANRLAEPQLDLEVRLDLVEQMRRALTGQSLEFATLAAG